MIHSQVSQMDDVGASEKEKNDSGVALFGEVIKRFEPKSFEPPLWFSNFHLQTIIGSLFRPYCLYASPDDTILSVIDRILNSNEDSGDSFIQWDERQRIETPDDDFFDVDWKYSRDRFRKGIVVLTHGLESNSASNLSRDMATAYHLQGFDVVCIHFRGCSGEPNRQAGAYHLSFTDDLELFLRQMNDNILSSHPIPIYLSGFSGGANVITKLLIQVGDNIYSKYNVCGAAVNALPFDLTKTAPNVSGRNFVTTAIYGNSLLKPFKKKYMDKTQQKILKNVVPYTWEEVNQCKTIQEFEEVTTCPVYGFQNGLDYWKKSSVIKQLDRVMVPLYIVNSKDDPFFEGDEMPDSSTLSPQIKINLSDHGGHCGFILHAMPDDEYDNESSLLRSSWMPTELARFVSYIHDQSHADL